MSEEEIKQIKQTLETWQHIVDFGYGTIEVPNETKIFKTILNLIDKQQKELEEVRQANKRLFEMGKDKAMTKLTNEIIENDYISKDKIKNEIKELESVKNVVPKDNNYTYKDLMMFGIEELEKMMEEK